MGFLCLSNFTVLIPFQLLVVPKLTTLWENVVVGWSKFWQRSNFIYKLYFRQKLKQRIILFLLLSSVKESSGTKYMISWEFPPDVSKLEAMITTVAIGGSQQVRKSTLASLPKALKLIFAPSLMSNILIY